MFKDKHATALAGSAFLLVLAFPQTMLASQTYTDVTAQMGISVPGLGSGTAWGDFDGDGDMDLLVSNSTNPKQVHLYRNDGSVFVNVTSASGLDNEARNFALGDYDNDGDEDCHVGRTSTNLLYRNNGNGTFTDIAQALNLVNPPDPFGTGFADYDNDGDMDVFLATHFGNKLPQCEGVTNQWIRISLLGTVSNRSAIGAVVKCVSGGVTTYVRVDGGHGMGDSDSKVLGLALG